MRGEISTNENFMTWIFISTFVISIMLFFIFLFVRMYYRNKIMKSNEELGSEIIQEQIEVYVNRPYELSQMVFEMVISNACIIMMVCLYHWIAKKVLFLQEYLNIVMLILILFAIVVNKVVDYLLEQDMLSGEDISNIRLLSSCSIICIFMLLRYFYHTDEYNELLISYVCLVLGRFIFFDSTWKQIEKVVKELKRYVIALLIEVALMCIIGWIGIKLNVITERSALVSVLVLHVVMIVCIKIAKKAVLELRSFNNIFI